MATNTYNDGIIVVFRAFHDKKMKRLIMRSAGESLPAGSVPLAVVNIHYKHVYVILPEANFVDILVTVIHNEGIVNRFGQYNISNFNIFIGGHNNE